ncbi:MAG: hypothetical protein J6Y28_08710 [Acholeplasmatales bacterium]|nr:hypothetical protein [Acholeplasmatales bacterium]
MIPMYNTKRFSEIWEDLDSFKTDYKASPLYDFELGVSPHNSLTDPNINKLYYLLYARYGNNPIVNFDINQFKFKVFSIIFEYGPNWQKELDIQDKLRGLSEDQLMEGHFAIYNQAAHDATAPGTSTTQELEYINNQNTTRIKKARLNAYNDLLILLKTDVTKQFINKFEPLFKKFLYGRPTLYETPIDDEEIVND